MSITFSPSPPMIVPNLLAFSIPRGMEWRRRPSGDDVAYAVNREGIIPNLRGHFTLSCNIGDDGRMNACTLAEEAPARMGLDRVAMDLAPLFRLGSAGGCPLGGGKISIPVRIFPGR